MFCEDPSKLCFGCTYVFKSRGGRLLPRRPAPQRGARAVLARALGRCAPRPGGVNRAVSVRAAPAHPLRERAGSCSARRASSLSLPLPHGAVNDPPQRTRTFPRATRRPTRVPAALDVKCWVLASFAARPLCRRRPGEGAPAGLSHHRHLLPGARDRPLRRSPAVAAKELRHGGHTALCAKVPAAICQALPGLTFNPSPFPVHPCLLRNEGYGETILIDNIKTDFSEQDDHFLSENISQVHSGAGRRCSDELARCRSTCRAESHDCIGVATSYKGPRGRSEANPQSRSPEGARTHTV